MFEYSVSNERWMSLLYTSGNRCGVWYRQQMLWVVQIAYVLGKAR